MTEKVVPVKQEKTSAHAALPDAWRNLRTEMDRLFDGWHLPAWRSAFTPVSLFPAFGAGYPAVDVAEDDNSFKITAELPGLNEKEVELAVSGEMLTLKGEKHQEKEEKKKNYYLSERSYGSFERSFALPQSVDRDKINAIFTNGVLTIQLPKTATAQKQEEKKITIKAA